MEILSTSLVTLATPAPTPPQVTYKLPSFPFSSFKPFEFPPLAQLTQLTQPQASAGFDLMEAILLVSSTEERKNAITNIKSILDAFGNELKLYQRSLIWTLEIFNLAFQLDDLDWIHFVLFSIFANMASIYQLFVKIANGEEYILNKLQKFHLHLLQSQEDFLNDVYTDENRKVYASHSESESELELQCRSPNLRKFIQDVRNFYLSL